MLSSIDEQAVKGIKEKAKEELGKNSINIQNLFKILPQNIERMVSLARLIE